MTSETPERVANQEAAQQAEAAPQNSPGVDMAACQAETPSNRKRGAPRKLLIGGREVLVYGMPIKTWGDFYHSALTMRWPTFFASLAALFLLLNGVFACLYQLGAKPIANQYPDGFLGAFFFSVETLATVGYGDMHPQTLYAHIIATLEIFVGMSGIALGTGLVFARFSRPRAKIMFAHNVVVHPIEGRMTLMVRAANARQNVIAEAEAKLRLIRVETSSDGYRLRRIHDLKLVRNQHPLFTLGWTLMHVIDEASPLYGVTPEALASQHATLHVVIEGSDESTAQFMQARYSWSDRQIRWHFRYVDLMSDADGVSTMDYTHFHDVIPFEGANPYNGPRTL
jgi:inward rectifier potassium channel